MYIKIFLIKFLDPYHPDESAKLPEGTELLTASVTAAGSVYYKSNGDGTITIYSVPSHFQGVGVTLITLKENLNAL